MRLRSKAGRVWFLPVVLIVAAGGLFIYGYSRGGSWLGAFAVFLLWWADNESKRLAKKEIDESLIAEKAPEIVGMDFAQAAVYILGEIDKFKMAASAEQATAFASALIQHQLEWRVRGEPMPPWATLALLRQFSADRPGVPADVGHSNDAIPHA